MKTKKIITVVAAILILIGAIGFAASTAEPKYAAKLNDMEFATIAEAVESANPGETIYVYKEWEDGFTIDKPLVFEGYTKLIGGKVNIPGETKVIGGIDGSVVIKNLDISGGISLDESEDCSMLELTVEECNFENSKIEIAPYIKGLNVKNCNFTAGENMEFFVRTKNSAQSITIDGNSIKGNGTVNGAVNLGNGNESGTVAEINGNAFSGCKSGVCISLENGVLNNVVVNENTFSDFTDVEGAPVHILKNAKNDNLTIAFNKNNMKNCAQAVYNETPIPVTDFAIEFLENTKDGKESGPVTENVKEQNALYPEIPEAEASVNTTQYSSFNEALESAATGETIKISSDIKADKAFTISKNTVIDLNGKTLTLCNKADNLIDAAVIIKNGTIDISGLSSGGSAFFKIGEDGNLTMDNVVLKGTNYNSEWAVLYAEKGNIALKNCTVDLSRDNSATGGAIKGEVDKKVSIINSTVNIDISPTAFEEVNVDIEKSTVSLTSIKGSAFKNVSGDIKETPVTIDNCSCGVKNSANTGPLILTGAKTVVKITNSTENDINLEGETYINVENGARLDATKIVGTVNKQADSSIVRKDNEIVVSFIPVKEGDKESRTLYDLVLSGQPKDITRLVSAQLTFYNESMGVTYSIVESTPGINISYNKDTYNFDMSGLNIKEGTSEIIIGRVTLSGSSDIVKIGIDESVDKTTDKDASNDNYIMAKKNDRSNVEFFKVKGDIKKGVGNIAVGSTIITPTRIPKMEFVLNVVFPNELKDSPDAFRTMQVSITGGDIPAAKEREYIFNISAIDNDAVKMTSDDGQYVYYQIKTMLTEFEIFNLKIVGDGFKPIEREITMSRNRTICLMNNMIDRIAPEDIDVEYEREYPFSSKIKLIDDATSVSHVYADRTEAKTVEWAYATYDINADGVKDSRDVAYIMVSYIYR